MAAEPIWAQEDETLEKEKPDIELPEVIIEGPREEIKDIEKERMIPGRLEPTEIDIHEQQTLPSESMPADLGEPMRLPELDEPKAEAGRRYHTSGSFMVDPEPDFVGSLQHGLEFERCFYKISAKGHSYEENVREQTHSKDTRIDGDGTFGLKITENADISAQVHGASSSHELPFTEKGSICNKDFDAGMTLRQKRPGGDHSLIQLYYRSIDLNYHQLDLAYDTALGSGADPKIDEAGMALRWSLDLAENNVLRVGGEVYQDKVEEEGTEDFDRTVVQVYLADRWKLDWTWPTVLRFKALYNEDDEHDGELGAQLRVSTSPADNWSLHLAGGFEQNIYSYISLYRDARYFLINRALKPSVEARGEIGGTYTHQGLFSSGLTIFYRVIDDYVAWRPVEGENEANRLWIPRNMGSDVKLIGCEASIGFETGGFLEHQLRYTYTHSETKDGMDEVVPFTPEHVAVYDLRATTDFGFGVGVRGAYTDRRYFTTMKEGPSDCGYFTLDVRVSQDIGENFTVFALGKNLTDDSYEERTGYEARGAQVYGGAEFRF